MVRPLTQEEKIGLLRRFTGGWQRSFTDVVDQTFDPSGFVADDVPRSPWATGIRAITRFGCRRWARFDQGDATLPANQRYAQVCNEYLNNISEKPTGGSLVAGGAPGRCPVAYTLTWVIGSYDEVRCDNGTRTSFPAGETLTTTITGPVDSLEEEDVLGSCGPTGVRGTRVMVGLNGQPPAQVLSAQTSFPSVIYIDNYSGGTLSLARVDGLPDNCAPNAQYDPPAPIPGLPTLPPTVEVDVPGLGPVDISIEFNPDGSVQFCIPELDICADVTLPGQEPVSTPAPGDLGEPGTPSETGTGDESTGETEAGEVLVGLNVEIISAPLVANKFTPDVFRGVAYIYMGNDSLKSLHFAGSNMRLQQFVFAETENLTHWEVAANPGYNLRITPHTREVEL